MSIEGEEKLHNSEKAGTLAIDLGNSNTVVAFQGEKDDVPTLLELPPITRITGQIPSLVWVPSYPNDELLIGNQVLKFNLTEEKSPNLSMDFKRWIGSSLNPLITASITPEEAGEYLLLKIWERIPSNLNIKRLVLTAPVNTYRAYRAWLQKICQKMNVKEIALVDEPTAAAMGAGVAPGSKLLVVDIGGSTIDLSLVALEGGEGKAEPVAQLMRFAGEDLGEKSKQKIRCAKVLGKAGLRLGGRDLDRWIVSYLFPQEEISEVMLNAAEKLKWRLSEKGVSESEYLIEKVSMGDSNNSLELRLNKMQFEDLLIQKGILSSLKKLLEKTLAGARANKCSLKDLTGVVAVGGGSRIPLIKKWLMQEVSPIELITPPPIEAVAVGALSLTPGVKVRDILQKGVSLQIWDEGRQEHFWYPLFVPGQPWPTEKGLEIILSASKNNQIELELKIGEPEIEGAQEIIYKNGIPTIQEGSVEAKVLPWTDKPISIRLDPPGDAGQDCLRLTFNIDEDSLLIMQGLDIRTQEVIKSRALGSVR